MNSKLRERLLRLLLVLGSVALFLLVGEVSCRVVHGDEFDLAGQGPAYGRWFHQQYSDPLGLRCGEPGCPPPRPDPEAYTILVLGDSVTFGSGVPYEEIFSVRMQRLLDQREDGVRYRVVNASAPGLDTEAETRELDRVAPHVQPDLILLVYFPNDVLREDDPRLDPFLTHMLGGKLGGWLFRNSHFYYFLESRLHRLQARFGSRPNFESVLLEAYDPDDPRLADHLGALSHLIQTVQLNRRQIAIVQFPILYRLEDYPFRGVDEMIAELGERLGAPTLDLLPAFQGMETDTLILSGYDNHPNARGHEIAAEAIVAGLVAKGLIPPNTVPKRPEAP